MAKFKPAKPKTGKSAPHAGLPCVILIICGMVMIFLFMYFAMKNAS